MNPLLPLPIRPFLPSDMRWHRSDDRGVGREGVGIRPLVIVPSNMAPCITIARRGQCAEEPLQSVDDVGFHPAREALAMESRLTWLRRDCEAASARCVLRRSERPAVTVAAASLREKERSCVNYSPCATSLPCPNRYAWTQMRWPACSTTAARSLVLNDSTTRVAGIAQNDTPLPPLGCSPSSQSWDYSGPKSTAAIAERVVGCRVGKDLACERLR